MTRILKYIGIFIAGIAFLLILAVAVINLIPGDKYKELISSSVKSATGRDLKIEGDLDIRLFSTFGLKASGIKFANADWGSKPHMVSVDDIEAEVALFPLLKGILDVTLLVDTSELFLESHSSGQGNWQFIELGEEVVKTVEQIEESVEEAQSGKGFPLRLRIRKVAITGTSVVHIDGKSGNQITLDKKKLIIEPTDGNLAIELEAKYNDIPLALSGDFGNAELFMDNQAAPVSLAGHVGDIKLAVQGSTGPITPTFDLNAGVKLNADSVAAFSPLAGQELPDIGPLAVSAQFIGKSGKYAVNDLLATLDDKIITAEVKASIANLVAMSGLKFEADIGTDQLAKTLEMLGLEVDPPTANSPVTAVAEKDNAEKATGRQMQPTIEVQESKTEGTSRITRTVTIKGVPSELLLDDKSQLDTDSLDQIVKNAQKKLPPAGSLKSNVNIIPKDVHPGSKENKTDLSSGNIQVTVAASVADVLKLSGINADIHLSVDSLTSLNDVARQELPASGPVTLEGKIDSKGDLKSPVQIDIVLKSDGVMANLTGSIAEPLAAKGIDLALNAEAESMQHVGKLTGTELVSTDLMKLEGQITSNTNRYELAGLNLQIGQLNVKGKAAFQQPTEPGDRPRVSAALHAGDMDLSIRQKAKVEAAEKNIEVTKNEDAEVVADEEEIKDKVFPSDPLPWKPLRTIDADIEVTVESLKTLQLNLEKIIAKVTLENGLLNVKPLQAKVGNGTFGGSATLDAHNSPATLAANIELSNATFRDFGGTVNFLVDLTGSGNSVAEIMAGLDGQLHFDVREVTLKKSFMTGFGTGLLSSLNPFTGQDEETKLICAIIFFDINDGIADANKKIAAQMTDVTWFGSGEINLRTEEIDFGMNPKQRKGLVSMGGLAKLAHIGGTLAHPKIQLDPKDVAVKYGKYAAAVSTGGLTLLADIVFSKVKANQDVCAAILEELDTIQEADEKSEGKTEKKVEQRTEKNDEGKTETKKSKKKKQKKSTFFSGDDYL